MAKRRGSGPTMSGYFRDRFKENLDWVKGTSNDAIFERWQADHTGQELTRKIKGLMANVKASMRKKLKIGRKKKKGRGKAKENGVLVAIAPKLATKARGGVVTLAILETKIDDVLALARAHEASGLAKIVKHLRNARNGVVVKQA